MPLTPEQRQQQLNRWKEGYISANPNLTPQQLAIVNGLEQLPNMLTYHTDTTMLRDESSRVMGAAQQAQQQAEAARVAAEAARQQATSYYTEQSGRVQQLNDNLLRTTAALNAITTVYEVTPEDMQRYGVAPNAPPPSNVAGAPSYQQQPPSSSQFPQQAYQPPVTGAQPAFGQQGAQPQQQQPVDVDAIVSRVGQRFIGAIAERDQVASRHFDLTGKMLDSSGVMTFMQTNGLTDYTEAWKQMHNISALEQARTQAAQQTHDDAIRAQTRAEMAAQQGAPGNPNPRFGESKVLGQFSPSMQSPTMGADGQPVERAGSLSRISAVAQAYSQRIANRGANGTGSAASGQQGAT